MQGKGFLVRFWGVRGSVPVSGEQYQRYGGNTACIELRCGGHRLFIDAGSGIRPAGKALLAAGVHDVDILFTHSHYDHIIGLPFFAPLYHPGVRLTVWSGHLAGTMTTEAMLREFVRPPWFPVELGICRSKLVTRDFRAGEVLRPRKGITVRTGSLTHPGGCIGYRIEHAGHAVAVISDTEHEDGVLDPVVLALIADADLVVYDCTYTDSEMAQYRGYGHSSWQQGIRLCRAAGARRLALFHHDAARSDEALAAIEAEAKSDFDGAFAACDGQEVAIVAG